MAIEVINGFLLSERAAHYQAGHVGDVGLLCGQ